VSSFRISRRNGRPLVYLSSIAGAWKGQGHDDIEIRYLYMWLSFLLYCTPYSGKVIPPAPGSLSKYIILPSTDSSTGQPWKQGDLRTSAILIPCINRNTVIGAFDCPRWTDDRH
jgi:hypothetical protein